MNTLSYSSARATLADTMDRVCGNHEPIIITRSGQASVVMMSLDDYKALEETARRRAKQEGFNTLHGISPQSIVKDVDSAFDSLFSAPAPGAKRGRGAAQKAAEPEDTTSYTSPRELARLIQRLEREMRDAAKELEFERAAELRDRIVGLQQATAGLPKTPIATVAKTSAYQRSSMTSIVAPRIDCPAWMTRADRRPAKSFWK